MIIVDTALAKRHDEGRPVIVAITGAGQMVRSMANRIVNRTPGMHLAVIVNRTPANAERCLTESGVDPVEVTSVAELDAAIDRGQPVWCQDPSIATRCERVDCVIESTGTFEYAAHVVTDAIDQAKHVVMLNAELDGLLGPLYQSRAAAAGVIYTGCDGDQPGVQMNLLRFVEGIGCRPVVAGNIKGMLDRYRNPDTQAAFAAQWDANVNMVTSFADGTKLNYEQVVVANATGMTVGQRGMYGPEFDGHVDDALGLFDAEAAIAAGGIVDYIVGAEPSPGVFVYATNDDAQQAGVLTYLKMGEGPLFSFYVPYHLCSVEVPTSAARAVLFDDPTIAPAGAPVADVVTVAKVDLAVGTTLDGLGGFHAYGLAESHDVTRRDDLVPFGLSEGCSLVRPVPADQALTWADVERPGDRLIDRQRAEQDELFPV